MLATYAGIKRGHMQLSFTTHGGFREGAGRKRKRARGVAHEIREKVSHRVPLHINFKYKCSVRNKDALRILKRSLVNARKHGMRILHVSFMTNHIHLIVEADSNETLTRSMRSLTITFAKLIKRGRIQIERYHLHILKTFREVKHAVHYVLFNQQKHDSGTYSVINEYTSVLSLNEGLVLARKFASKTKMTLKIDRGETWVLDRGMSYIYNRGWKELLGDT